ncbi:hypothetical protein [Indiicoccus explosivorum]|uniref:hypothetical protein n=1 Tax=Indiicoccus explosivorum TaxID=1917864 RepID=UPI000B437A8E|nr:hypothetical protein [Indiicoccus explosivorum]
MEFDFSSLFAEYNRPFQLIPRTPSDRDYSRGGQTVKGTELPAKDMQGIVVPLGNDDLRFDTAGTYTRQDRKIYLQEPKTLAENDVVTVDSLSYRITGDKPYGHYAGFNVYYAKRTSMGDGGR